MLGDNFCQYVVIEATAELSPVAADPHDATVEALIGYYAAGPGEHPDWDEYRAAMITDKRLVLTLRPERAYGMGVGAEVVGPGRSAGDRAQPAGWGSGSVACVPAPLPPAWPSDSSTSWERSSTRTSSSLSLARTASSSMIMQ